MNFWAFVFHMVTVASIQLRCCNKKEATYKGTNVHGFVQKKLICKNMTRFCPWATICCLDLKYSISLALMPFLAFITTENKQWSSTACSIFFCFLCLLKVLAINNWVFYKIMYYQSLSWWNSCHQTADFKHAMICKVCSSIFCFSIFWLLYLSSWFSGQKLFSFSLSR